MDFPTSFPAPPGGAETPAEDVVLDQNLYTMIELEGTRYRTFFAKLAQGERLISRDAALEFFRKSSLTDPQVQELYNRIKDLALHGDPERVNETEFVLGMHFIVCMTKRHLTKIPPKFPTYLFPTLDLTPEPSRATNDVDFGFASLSMDSNANSNASKASSDAPLVDSSSLEAQTVPISFTATSPAAPGARLQDVKSLSELLGTELGSRQHEAEVLARVDQSEAKALQSLRGCLELLVEQVDALGFPVPTSARAVDAMDDLRNLLQKHVHTAKQEIQELQISAQMRSVAAEVQSSDSREDPLRSVSGLTQELVALQQETARLAAKRDDLVQRVLELRKGVPGGATSIQQSSAPPFGASNGSRNPAFALSKGALTVGELGMPSDELTPPNSALPAPPTGNKPTSEVYSDPFGFAAPGHVTPPATTTTTSTHAPASDLAATPHVTDNDYAWGSFQ